MGGLLRILSGLQDPHRQDSHRGRRGRDHRQDDGLPRRTRGRGARGRPLDRRDKGRAGGRVEDLHRPRGSEEEGLGDPRLYTGVGSSSPPANHGKARARSLDDTGEKDSPLGSASTLKESAWDQQLDPFYRSCTSRGRGEGPKMKMRLIYCKNEEN